MFLKFLRGRKVIFFDQCNLIRWEELENQNLRISSKSCKTTEARQYYFVFFVTPMLYVNLVWLSVHVCVCGCVRACVFVRLFSGLSHRSLRCLADFYADGLINWWETLVLHRGSLLSSTNTRHDIHTLWHLHTHTTDVGTERKPKQTLFNLTSPRWKTPYYTAEERRYEFQKHRISF